MGVKPIVKNKLLDKKVFIISTILFMYSILGNCQVGLGIKGGINYGIVKDNLDPPNSDYYDNAIGYRLGLTLQYRFKILKFGTGCLISLRPTCANYSFLGNDCSTLQFVFIEIPISVYRTFYNNKIELGFSIINGITKYPPISLIEDKVYETDLEFLIGWNINKRFNFELSYLFGGLDALFSNRDTHLYYVSNLSLNYTFYRFKKTRNKIIPY